MNLAILGLAVIVLILAGLWLIIPACLGLPSIPTRADRIRKALKLAKLQPGEILYDLGCGNGRVLLVAAREFGAQAVGIEAGPVQCAIAWLTARLHGVGRRVSVRCADFFKTDLGPAQVVFAYLTASQSKRLKEQLESQLQPGARVVTVSFEIPGWQPELFDNDELIYLYRIPTNPAEG